MGERAPAHNEEYDAEVVQSPAEVTTLHEINDESIGDVELERIVETVVERKAVLSQDDDYRARYILKTILTAIGCTSDIETLVGDNDKLIDVRRADAKHTSGVDLRVKHAEHWLIWHKEQFDSYQTGEKLLEYIELIKQDWPPTNLYRAFEMLAEKIRVNRTDQFADAVVKAHRLAVVMMAQATSGYTKTSE